MSPGLLMPCLITVAAETFFFAITGYRDTLFLLLAAAVNAATNLALNMALIPLSGFLDMTYFIYPMEALVVVLEYAVYALAMGRSRRLFLLTLAANVITYTLGAIIYGHL